MATDCCWVKAHTVQVAHLLMCFPHTKGSGSAEPLKIRLTYGMPSMLRDITMVRDGLEFLSAIRYTTEP
jgi:hypothetical protein